MSQEFTRAGLEKAIVELKARHPEWGRTKLAAALGLPVTKIAYAYAKMVPGGMYAKNAPRVTESSTNTVEIEVKGETAVASSRSTRITSLEELLAATKVDLNVWEVERHVVNKWEVGRRDKSVDLVWTAGAADGHVKDTGKIHVEPLWQIKIWLKRRSPQVLAGESILKRIAEQAPVLGVPEIRRRKLPHRRAFEICIMDPHIGLLCQKPEADAAWDMDKSAAAIMASIDDLVAKAKHFGPFEQAFMPFGNDFVHTDTVFHTTTAGTGQPEAIAWHAVYERAEQIAIEMVNRLRPIAKELFIYEVPGNHSRMADYTLAHLLRAYFRHDRNVHVDASSSPYKFHRYGKTLIGYEHGHSVSAIRLAALMANERRQDWAETEYREFHLGDQHRKGSSNPAAFEEQSVSIEYIPGLTAPNEWHRLKAFNHQKRGAMAWVYDFNTGPVARFQHNISQYSE